MAQEIIDIGVLANDGTGDPLRVAFDKINNNFIELYNSSSITGPNGAVQFALANTSGNITTYELDSSANLTFNSSNNTLSIRGTILPLAPNMLNIGSISNTVGNLYVSNNGFRFGNVNLTENLNTVNFSINGNALASLNIANLTTNSITANSVVVDGVRSGVVTSQSVGNTQGQIIMTISEPTLNYGTFNIKSQSLNTSNNQSTMIAINKNGQGTNIKFTATNTLFNGSPLTSYDVDVAFGSIRIKVNPLVTDTINHTITYTITQ